MKPALALTSMLALALTAALALATSNGCASEQAAGDNDRWAGRDGGHPSDRGADPDEHGPSDTGSTADGDRPGGESSLFVEGCPVAGRSLAKPIVNPRLRAEGPDAVTRPGDFLLINSKAAFVVEGADNHDVYYTYGGMLVDAVALDGCRQASAERFQELGLLLGELRVTDLSSSVVRAFRADRVELVSDGADGGPAVVRATGTDDHYWLVEGELVRIAFDSGKPRRLSLPYGLEIVVDYVLPPESNVLRIDVTLRTPVARQPELRLLVAAQVLFGTTTTERHFAHSVLPLDGYVIDLEVPWVAASSGSGAWAFSLAQGASMAAGEFRKVRGMVDANQAIWAPLVFSAAGDSASFSWFLSVGGTDSNSAVRHLQAINPEPLPGYPYTQATIQGTVRDEESGLPLAGVLIELQAQNQSGAYRVLDSYHSGPDGVFAGVIPDFGQRAVPLRLLASSPGRTSPPPLPVVATAAQGIALTMPPLGKFGHDVRDQTGAGLPAKILLWQQGVEKARVFTTGAPGEAPVEPGEYEVSVTRGYEYTTYQGKLTVVAGQTATLTVTLSHLVDTTGFLSMDGHIHAAPSADNLIQIPDRILTVAGEGLEVAVSTDHEFVGSWQSGVEETGLSALVATVTGQEVTASMPEHLNMYPVVPDYSQSARGGIIPWYGLDLEAICSAIRARGARIVQLNHPGYIWAIGYDTLTGQATLSDPTVLGLPTNARLWSWSFDAIEVMNGPAPVLGDPNHPSRQGYFDAWMSFLNLGHRVTAVGNSDAHDYTVVGTPRNYFASSSDSPAAFDENEMVDSLLAGRVLVSTGAFARVQLAEPAGGGGELADLGDTLTTASDELDLQVHIEAIPEIDVSHFKVFVNCDQVATVDTTTPQALVKYDGTLKLKVERDSHVVVMGFGKQPLPPGFRAADYVKTPRFLSNPIFVDRDGNRRFDPPGGKSCSYTGP